MKILRRTLTAAVALTAAITLASCSSGAPQAPVANADAGVDELVQAAKSEGQLTFYGDGSEASIQKWVQGFTDEYGIAVNILRMPGNQLTQRFAQEMSSGQHQADIMSSTDRAFMKQAIDKKWLANYTPEEGAAFPEDKSAPGYFYPVQNGFFQAVAYNPTLLSQDEIKMLREDPIKAVADPAFKGRIALGAPHASQQTSAFYYRLTEGDEAGGYGWGLMDKIAANDPVVQLQTVTMLQNLIAGEYAVAVALTDSVIAPQVMEGAPVEFAYPKYTTGSTFSTGIAEGAPHPNAARLFMEWATTAEANERYSGITQTVPTNKNVVDSRELLKSDWYVAPDQSTVWSTFIDDADFLKASGPDGDFLDDWSKVFNYNGG